MARRASAGGLLSGDFGTTGWAVAIIGALGLLYYFSTTRRRGNNGRGGASRPTAIPSKDATLISQLQEKKHIGWKVGVASEVFLGKATEEAIVNKLASICDVFVFVRVDKDKAKAAATIQKVKSAVPAVKPIQILPCVSDKGHEAFARQLTPAILLTADSTLGNFLAQFLPYIVLVGDSAPPMPAAAGQKASRTNITRVAQLGALPWNV